MPIIGISEGYFSTKNSPRFAKQSMLEGLLALEEELNMESIKVMEIVIPPNPNLLPNLRFFNLNHNDLAYLPKDMDQLKSLCVLKVRETLLT